MADFYFASVILPAQITLTHQCPNFDPTVLSLISMKSKRERRKPQRFHDENLEKASQSSKKTLSPPAMPAKRVRKKPQRLEDEIPDPPPVKKQRMQSELKKTMEKTHPKPKKKLPRLPSRDEVHIRTVQASGAMNARKTKAGNSYAVKPKTKTVIDISDAEVYVQTATSSQIKDASKKKYRPTKADKSKLIQIPSHLNRAKIYLNAAKAISKKEAKALPSHGARPWFCHLTLSDKQGAWASTSNHNDDIFAVKKDVQKKGKMTSSPLFVWNKYHLELAVLPHILNNIDEIDTNHGLLKSVQDEVSTMETGDGYITDDEDYINQLVEGEVTILSTIAYKDSNYVIPSIDRKWISPDLVTFRSRSAAVQHSLMLLDRDKLIDRVLHGIGSRGAVLRPVKPTRKLALEAGYCRFLRDGLWVVGQEEDWIEERILNLKEQEETVVKKKNNAKNSNCNDPDGDEVSQDTKSMTQSSSSDSEDAVIGMNQQDDHESNEMDLESNPRSEEILKGHEENSQKSQLQYDNDDDQSKAKVNQGKNAKEFEGTGCCERDGSYEQNTSAGSAITSISKPLILQVYRSSDDKAKANIEKKSKMKKKADYTFTPSSHWRLNPKQIDMCYNAIMEHYEKVMYTVKAKALYPELADGFDIFRERGRGRFDMTIEAFDTPDFNFLTDLKNAAWMPIVNKILGDDAILVHKGAFLSMPGAETQVYHQDGVHLNKKYQKPCHAINVFIPLIDLNDKNGPTEFCIGTHFLGYEDYNKELIDTPLAAAGSPVIFDYRLGHRGLGNNSRDPRPILYLTYTRGSKEFRDAVNFSTKRYRKLGELIEKPMSRKERALKRTRES